MRLSIAVLFTILIIWGVCVDEKVQSQLRHRSSIDRGHHSIGERENKPRERINGIKSTVHSKPIGSSCTKTTDTTAKSRLQSAEMVTFIVTAYTRNDYGMDGRGITSSGRKARHMHTVASRGLKIGTRIRLVELNRIVVVEDKFGVHKAGNRLDLYIGGPNAKSKAIKFGKRKIKGVILR